MRYGTPSPVKPDKNNPNKLTQFVYDWAASNIFRFKRWDGIAYSIFYMIIPIALTFAGMVSSKDNLAIANFHLSVIINALNCIYDAFGRWDDNMPVKKCKLIVIIGCCAVLFMYSLLCLAVTLSGNAFAFRYDGILYLYLPAVVVAATDIIALTGRAEALKEIIKD